MSSRTELRTRAPLFLRGLIAVGAAAMLAACGNLGFADVREIRERIEQMRAATAAEDAEGIVQFATPDWTFEGAGKKPSGRTTYLDRTKKAFQNLAIESLKTNVQSLEIDAERADVRLQQTMVCSETNAAGESVRWKIVYLESQEWVKTTRGWLVARVQTYPPKREKLSRS